MQRFDLIIFDWDGTLMDSISKIVDCMQALARELSIAEPTEKAVRDVIGLSMPEAMRALFPDETEATRSGWINRYKAHYQIFNATPSPLFDGVPELLTSLQGASRKLAIATGKGREGLNRILDETRLGAFFHASRCADETQSKPHPQMLHELLAELDVSPERAVMIGDSAFDLQMANNAGVAAIGVDYGTHDRDTLLSVSPLAVVSHPLEILHHLR
ncbi:HAD-IA family hydrolase [Shewanella zhangzhouensis]|uniref:HAD-IA family hydrolase n=1 Tax=Shewanella zhangzhouensis TaxID=2864213 RepID=UPI001C659E4B|nr:HAD-IA family hydrolase [Shewanella zhangzhouensis]QYK03669.1 HAD-IA family hydrolase [Shewanella zhangzhouensis]